MKELPEDIKEKDKTKKKSKLINHLFFQTFLPFLI